MAQSGGGVCGIDVAKDKVDVSIRSLSQRQMFLSTPEGRPVLAMSRIYVKCNNEEKLLPPSHQQPILISLV